MKYNTKMKIKKMFVYGGLLLFLGVILVSFYSDAPVLKEIDSIDLKVGINNLITSSLGPINEKKNTCPQINVPMVDSTWGDLKIPNREYDGWVIKGYATCKKGTEEGENINMYYCGGYDYSSLLGVYGVNAYIQKTDISKDGEIGKTYKYVIWNIYDENKNFVETRCIGDPDEFDQKRAEAFENEMLKWN